MFEHLILQIKVSDMLSSLLPGVGLSLILLLKHLLLDHVQLHTPVLLLNLLLVVCSLGVHMTVVL